MPNRAPIGIDEWYHCYNRGVDKRRIFEDQRDYERFLLTMYAGNSTSSIHISNFNLPTIAAVIEKGVLEQEDPLVSIGAYCLMPNHFHFVLKEIKSAGIARFMQKVCTGYTMYFNKKNERTGALFAGTFKSKHVPDDRYLKHLISYVHLNPAELFDARWKYGTSDVAKIEQKLLTYRYSSLPEFLGKDRAEKLLLDPAVMNLYEKRPRLKEIVAEANEYFIDVHQG
jgi:putative transposase